MEGVFRRQRALGFLDRHGSILNRALKQVLGGVGATRRVNASCYVVFVRNLNYVYRVFVREKDGRGGAYRFSPTFCVKGCVQDCPPIINTGNPKFCPKFCHVACTQYICTCVE